MAASISTVNNNSFDCDQNVTYRISDETCGDVAVVIVKKEALSDDESILNSDSNDEFYEFVDTSLPVDVVCSELQNVRKTPEHGSILLNLLTDSTLKNHQQVYKDDECTLNTYSKSSLKLHLVGNEDKIKKCQKQSKLTRSLKLVSKKVVQIGAQKSEMEAQECQPGKLKFIQCNGTFGLKSHLEMHEIGQEHFRNCINSFSGQEMIIIKEEVLSDDEGVLNDASADEYYNTGGTSLPVNVECLEMENDNLVSLANNTSDQGLNVVEVLADSTLRNFRHVYDDVESALGLDSKTVNLHLANNKDRTRKHREHISFVNSLNVNVKKVTQQRQLKTKSVIAPSYVTPAVEHEFKCQECSETFELKSHLVMHEISHEQYRRYKALLKPDYTKKSQSDQRIYKCKECNANFELKSSFILHELWHEKQRNKLCRCKSALSASVSDLCTCVVRICTLCSISFFASVRLRNWTSCVRCLLQMDSRRKIKRASAVKTQASKRFRNKVSDRNFVSTVTDVKRLCYSCGKMCANVVKFGTSWTCYDCWNAKLKQKCATNVLGLNNEILEQESVEYSGLNCTYCLRLFPLKSYQPNHKCFHKSVYLWNHCTWFDDCNEREDEDVELSERGDEDDVELNERGDEDVELNERGDEEDVEMVIDTTELPDINDGSSSSKVILCDKTGELIDLRSEADTSASDKTRKSSAGGESN
jgi:hypothetical protein